MEQTERYLVVGTCGHWMVFLKIVGGGWALVRADATGPKVWREEHEALAYVQGITGSPCKSIRW